LLTTMAGGGKGRFDVLAAPASSARTESRRPAGTHASTFMPRTSAGGGDERRHFIASA
jgi:hypothetical protein